MKFIGQVLGGLQGLEYRAKNVPLWEPLVLPAIYHVDIWSVWVRCQACPKYSDGTHKGSYKNIRVFGGCGCFDSVGSVYMR